MLAGQVYQDNVIVPTRSVNLWFSSNTIFAEAGGKLLEDRALWSRAIRRSRAGKLSTAAGTGEQAPRAAQAAVAAGRRGRSGNHKILSSATKSRGVDAELTTGCCCKI